MTEEVQEFLGKELLHHAETHGFAFLIEERSLLNKSMERFDLTRSQALWEITLFIQENGGPRGDLAIIERDGERYFQWRYVKWPSWLPRFVKRPRWHRKPERDRAPPFDL
ncbi:MAG: hypothetical protein PVJ38_03740 [Candidatus Bathyarchaeota archaeon]|jgi:hypothetical protein